MLRIRGRYSLATPGAPLAEARHRRRTAAPATPAAMATNVAANAEPAKAVVPAKLIVVVPYRDRAANLALLVPALHQHLADIERRIVVVEQAGNEVFNKGRLMNAGFDLHRDEDAYFCFHDVDLLPENAACDYTYPATPTHVSLYCSQHDYRTPYANIFGGVVLFNRRDFVRVNGYSNGYWGWGYEDDDIARRARQRGLAIAHRQGRYTSLSHGHTWKSDDASRRNHARLWSGYPYIADGLSSLRYQLLDVSEGAGYTRYLVDIGAPDGTPPGRGREPGWRPAPGPRGGR